MFVTQNLYVVLGFILCRIGLLSGLVLIIEKKIMGRKEVK